MLLSNWHIMAAIEASVCPLNITSQFLWDLSTPEEKAPCLFDTHPRTRYIPVDLNPHVYNSYIHLVY
jgi:hypothetical protein